MVVIKLTDKRLYTLKELCQLYGVSSTTVSARIGDAVYKLIRGTRYWDITEVSTLNDVRNLKPKVEGAYKNQWGEYDPNDEDSPELDPNKMKAAERRLHWQAEDLRQSMLIKQRKNQVESRELIPAQEVEKCLALAFKTIALTLDTLPDALERDGMIKPNDIGSIITIMDGAREQLAESLKGLSKEVELIEMMGGFK